MIFLLENSLTVVTFKIFFPKFFLRIFANWAIDGAHYTFHKKLVELAKFLKSQDFKSTIKEYLTCTFLSLRANSNNPVCLHWPCKYIQGWILINTNIQIPSYKKFVWFSTCVYTCKLVVLYETLPLIYASKYFRLSDKYTKWNYGSQGKTFNYILLKFKFKLTLNWLMMKKQTWCRLQSQLLLFSS